MSSKGRGVLTALGLFLALLSMSVLTVSAANAPIVAPTCGSGIKNTNDCDGCPGKAFKGKAYLTGACAEPQPGSGQTATKDGIVGKKCISTDINVFGGTCCALNQCGNATTKDGKELDKTQEQLKQEVGSGQHTPELPNGQTSESSIPEGSKETIKNPISGEDSAAGSQTAQKSWFDEFNDYMKDSAKGAVETWDDFVKDYMKSDNSFPAEEATDPIYDSLDGNPRVDTSLLNPEARLEPQSLPESNVNPMTEGGLPVPYNGPAKDDGFGQGVTGFQAGDAVADGQSLLERATNVVGDVVDATAEAVRAAADAIVDVAQQAGEAAVALAENVSEWGNDMMGLGGPKEGDVPLTGDAKGVDVQSGGGKGGETIETLSQEYQELGERAQELAGKDTPEAAETRTFIAEQMDELQKEISRRAEQLANSIAEQAGLTPEEMAQARADVDKVLADYRAGKISADDFVKMATGETEVRSPDSGVFDVKQPANEVCVTCEINERIASGNLGETEEKSPTYTGDSKKAVTSTYGWDKGSGDSSTQPLANPKLKGDTLADHPYTFACKTCKFGEKQEFTYTNPETGESKSIVLEANDRGPYVAGRTYDISRQAAEELGMGYTVKTLDVRPVSRDTALGLVGGESNVLVGSLDTGGSGDSVFKNWGPVFTPDSSSFWGNSSVVSLGDSTGWDNMYRDFPAESSSPWMQDVGFTDYEPGPLVSSIIPDEYQAFNATELGKAAEVADVRVGPDMWEDYETVSQFTYGPDPVYTSDDALYADTTGRPADVVADAAKTGDVAPRDLAIDWDSWLDPRDWEWPQNVADRLSDPEDWIGAGVSDKAPEVTPTEFTFDDSGTPEIASNAALDFSNPTTAEEAEMMRREALIREDKSYPAFGEDQVAEPGVSTKQEEKSDSLGKADVVEVQKPAGDDCKTLSCWYKEKGKDLASKTERDYENFADKGLFSNCSNPRPGDACTNTAMLRELQREAKANAKIVAEWQAANPDKAPGDSPSAGSPMYTPYQFDSNLEPIPDSSKEVADRSMPQIDWSKMDLSEEEWNVNEQAWNDAIAKNQALQANADKGEGVTQGSLIMPKEMHPPQQPINWDTVDEDYRTPTSEEVAKATKDTSQSDWEKYVRAQDEDRDMLAGKAASPDEKGGIVGETRDPIQEPEEAAKEDATDDNTNTGQALTKDDEQKSDAEKASEQQKAVDEQAAQTADAEKAKAEADARKAATSAKVSKLESAVTKASEQAKQKYETAKDAKQAAITATASMKSEAQKLLNEPTLSADERAKISNSIKMMDQNLAKLTSALDVADKDPQKGAIIAGYAKAANWGLFNYPSAQEQALAKAAFVRYSTSLAQANVRLGIGISVMVRAATKR